MNKITSTLLCSLLFLFANVQAQQTNLWQEHPIMFAPQCITSDGAYIYVSGQHIIIKVKIADGSKEYFTQINKGELSTSSDLCFDDETYIMANPNRSEKIIYNSYEGVGHSCNSLSNNWTSIPDSGGVGASVATDRRLSSNGNKWFAADWLQQQSIRIVMIDTTGVFKYYYSEGYASENTAFAIDKNSYAWFVSYSEDSMYQYSNLVGYNGTDTIIYHFPNPYSQYTPAGMACNDSVVYFLNGITFATDSFRLMEINKSTGHINFQYAINDSLVFQTDVSFLHSNLLAANSQNAFAISYKNGEPVILKFNGATPQVIDHNAFGVRYKYIETISDDGNGNIFLLGKTDVGFYTSYTSDGVNWHTVALFEKGASGWPAFNFSHSKTKTYSLFNRNFVMGYKDGNYVSNFRIDSVTGINKTYGNLASSQNDVLWFSAIDSSINGYQLVRWDGTTTASYNLPNLFSVSSSFSLLASDSVAWFSYSKGVYKVSASGVQQFTTTSIGACTSFGLFLNNRSEPVIYCSSKWFVYHGGSWQQYSTDSVANIGYVAQLPDSNYIIIGESKSAIFNGSSIIRTAPIPYNYLGNYIVGNNDNLYLFYFLSSPQLADSMDVIHPDLSWQRVKLPGLAPNPIVTCEFLQAQLSDSVIMFISDENILVYNPKGDTTTPFVYKYNLLSGRAYFDYNNNGVFDLGTDEAPFNLGYTLNSSKNSTQQGNSHFYIPSDSGAVRFYVDSIAGFYRAPTSVSHNFGPSYGEVFNSPDCRYVPISGTHNLKVDMAGNCARKGGKQELWISCKNIGAENVSGSLVFQYDNSLVNLDSSSVTPDSTNGASIAWHISLSPGQSFWNYIQMGIPSTLSLGTDIDYVLDGNINQSDIDLSDNHAVDITPVVSSVDPNDKIVSPAGSGPYGNVDTAQELTYSVFFQNIGNAVALNVVVRDTLDYSFDIKTFHLISSSSPATINFYQPNVIEFTFANINLPDSFVNKSGSHGYVKYAVTPKHALPNGTTIKNAASVYFDYNQPLRTNGTLNTIGSSIATIVSNPSSTNNLLAIYPNPGNGNFELTADASLVNSNDDIVVYNAEGKIVMRQHLHTQQQEINLTPFAGGIYLVEVKHNNKLIASCRVVKSN